MPHHRRGNRIRRILTVAGGSVGALLLLAAGRNQLSSRGMLTLADSCPLQQGPLLPPTFFTPPPPELLLSEAPARQESEADLSFARRLLPNRRRSQPQQHPEDDAVLLPDDGEVLVLAAEPAVGNSICVFQTGASSPARALGRLPGPGRHAYLCLVPDSLQQPLQAPRLLPSSAAAAPAPAPAHPAAAHLLNWSNTSFVFDSAVLDRGGDVLVFAKGRHQGLNTPPAHVQCLYSSAASDGGKVASFPAIASAQQVIRCPPPPSSLRSGRITLALKGDEPLPSLATFSSDLSVASGKKKKLICACTMVRDVAKFLPEWVQYHAAVGVENFYIYDNGSQDDLADQVRRLQTAGFSILTVAWPWTKTQEAGLSHCAAVHRSSCQWMAFIDLDEFVFSPIWSKFERPSPSMLEAVVNVDPGVGQVYLPCYDFGPSGQTSHPREGVCQGYVCRLNKPERHKSLVRLDAVDDSLKNSVHHFQLKPGFDFKWSILARINHYKFQAWEEFKQKFKRRVSAYVADWRDPVNLKSADRAPGLGVDPIEPPSWAERFCDCIDSTMKDLSIKWFGVAFRGPGRTGDISPSPSPSLW